METHREGVGVVKGCKGTTSKKITTMSWLPFTFTVLVAVVGGAYAYGEQSESNRRVGFELAKAQDKANTQTENINGLTSTQKVILEKIENLHRLQSRIEGVQEKQSQKLDRILEKIK